MTETVVSLRKFSREAPGIDVPVLVVHEGRVIGEFIPRVSAPRSAQDGSVEATEPLPGPGSAPPAVTPARSGAPRTRAADVTRHESAPGGAPRFRPAPKPTKKP